MAIRLPVALPVAIAAGGIALVIFGGDFAQAAGVVLLAVAIFIAVINIYTHRGVERESASARDGGR